MAQLALMIDLARCIGCGSCEAACKLEHHLGPGQFRTRILTLTRPDDPERLEYVKAVCQQCERPACMRACGAGAISKSPYDGIVTIDPERCTGCQECVRSCPYGVMSFDPRTQHADKCTLSAERRAVGLPPACVSVCPTNALSWGTTEELRERAERGERAGKTERAGKGDHPGGSQRGGKGERAETGERVIRMVDHFGLAPSTIYLEHVSSRTNPVPTGAR